MLATFVRSKYGQFIIRALVTGAIGSLTYVGVNATDVADPTSAATVTTLSTAAISFLQARAAKEAEV